MLEVQTYITRKKPERRYKTAKIMTFSQPFANIVRRDSRLGALFLSKDRPKTKVPGGSRVTSLNLRSYNSNWHPRRSSKRDELLSRFCLASREPRRHSRRGDRLEQRGGCAHLPSFLATKDTQELIPRPRRACTRRWSPEIEFSSLSLTLSLLLGHPSSSFFRWGFLIFTVGNAKNYPRG